MLQKPLVSVVIPSYNYSKYIGKTIESVLEQTFEDLELIIIDDGSPDNSVEIIKDKIAQYADRDITFIHRENRGICRTLNEGLHTAKGKYFSYVGSDDFWHPQKLEKQLAAFETANEKLAASYTDSYIIDAGDKIIDRFGRQYDYQSGDIYGDLMWMRYHPASPTNFFIKEALTSIGGFNEKYAIEDKDLWIKIARKYEVIYLSEPLAYYRVHGKNMSTNNPEITYNYYIQVVHDSIENDPALSPFRKSIESRVMALQAAACYESLDLDKARKFALQSLARTPLDKMAWRTLVFSLLGSKIIRSIREKRRNQVRQDFSHVQIP